MHSPSPAMTPVTTQYDWNGMNGTLINQPFIVAHFQLIIIGSIVITQVAPTVGFSHRPWVSRTYRGFLSPTLSFTHRPWVSLTDRGFLSPIVGFTHRPWVSLTDRGFHAPIVGFSHWSWVSLTDRRFPTIVSTAKTIRLCRPYCFILFS
jgi:hypothetical protein